MPRRKYRLKESFDLSADRLIITIYGNKEMHMDRAEGRYIFRVKVLVILVIKDKG